MASQNLRRLPWFLGIVLLVGATRAQAQYPGAPPGAMGPGGLPPAAYGPGAYGPGGYGPGAYGPPAYGPGAFAAPPGNPGYPPGAVPGYAVPGGTASAAGYGAGGGYGAVPVAYYLQDGSVIQPVPTTPPQATSEEAPVEEGYSEYGDEMYGDEVFAGLGDGSLLGLLLPYGEGGICTPRWVDVHFAAVNLAREKASRRVDFASLGIAPPNGDPNIVLSSENLDFDDEWGARITVARQVGPGSNIEFNFLGFFNYAASAAVQDPNQGLFSVMSDYGRNPAFGFAETDFATYQGIDYSSAFNSYELMYRRRWQGRNCRLQGSYLAGVRYMQVTEDFGYHTRANGLPNTLPGFYYMDYAVGTNNSLTGFQFGGDAWVSIIPGFRIGAEGKVGIYGNHSHQNTVINASSLPNGFTETLRSDDAAFIGEANAMAVYRVNYHWTFRGGYQLLFMDGLALAIENFNPGQPFVDNPVLAPVRVPSYNDNGQIFYHGWNVGFEYIW
ncbi:MAG: BBP7 family outer membrane beta-barrel protein [Pirellulales bacterium]